MVNHLMVNNSEINLKNPVETIILDVGGMKCAGCVKAVERQLTQQSGVISACVNLVTEMAAVECQVGAVNPVELADRLTATGFPTQPRPAFNPLMGDRPYTEVIERQQQEIRATIAQLAIAALLIVLSGVGHIVHFPWLGGIWFHFGLATAALLLPGRAIVLDGWRGWWHGSPNMNTLVGLGALSAYLASTVALLYPKLGWECFFDEPVMLLGFILLGRTLEKLARHRAAASLQALLTLKPTTARLLGKSADAQTLQNPASAIEIPADLVRVGEFLQVLPGEKIPIDGEVVLGNTSVNESMLTGEAIPVAKQPGDIVTGGSLNQSGAIAFRVTRTGSDTTLAQIIRLVEQAQTRKAPVQQLADTVAGYFTYGVMTIATFTFLFWYFAGSKIWPDAIPVGHSLTHAVEMPVHPSPLLLSLKLAIAVLVIACPCALGLATPTAILVGTGVGAEQGLLIRGGDILERVKQLDTVVFDKTGTLTAGYPVVTDCILLGGIPPTPLNQGGEIPPIPLNQGGELAGQEKLLQLAASAEQGTNHPLAIAILQAAEQQGLPLLDAKDFYTEPGLGISATVAGEKVLVGTAQWLEQHGITLEPLENESENESFSGKTLVYVAQGNQLQGCIALKDQLRPDAQETVQNLQLMGLRVVMLTGDRAETAQAIAQQLGIGESDIFAGVLPAAKAQAIATLQTAGHIVAMVGDGINDAPALAQADIGISLHGSTDVAVETAGIVLMRNCLIDVVKSIQLSRATFNKIRQNLFWAFAYNTLGIPIAAGLLLPQWGIILSPSTAGAMMAFSSVSVVTNSLLLRRSKLLNQ
jgi:Cu2+-exporting ATPase